MKRIAALAAVMFGLLAIPTAALASTSSPGDGGPGYGSGYGTTLSGQPYECLYGFHKVHHHHGYRRYFDWWRNGREYTAGSCPFQQEVPQYQPQSQQCQTDGQTLVFSVAAGSSQMTEISGPQLSPTQEFTWDDSTYTVMTINPGADQFTAFVNNFLFTNGGSAITDASGVLVACSS